jgi:cardiolipin synthase A/B
MWTDKDILAAMIQAHDRGVDVRVILEGNVYGLPHANTAFLNALKAVKISTVYADTYRYAFTHAKFWLIDDRFYISTGNLTRSFFEGNRDFIFSSSESGTLDFLEQVFQADALHEGVDRAKIPSHVVVSPIDARTKIEGIMTSAKQEVIVYTQTLEDDDIKEILTTQQNAWVRVRVCTAVNESNTESASGTALAWTFLAKPYLHGKIIIIDNKKIFLGSQNLTKNSLENNREIGIILAPTSDMFARISSLFQKDCIFR